MPTAAPAAEANGEHTARKRRRRRGGKRVDGGAEATPMQAPMATKPSSKPASSAQVVATRVAPKSDGGAPSLLSRIKRRLESIVTRGPRSQH